MGRRKTGYSFNTPVARDRYKEGQQYHPTIHKALKLRGWGWLDKATDEEDQRGIDYWWELSDRMYKIWPTFWDSGKKCRIVGVDYKVMFGDHLGVQSNMVDSDVDGYLFARVYTKKKEMRLYYINKKDFWNHPRLQSGINRHNEAYHYVHHKFTKTIAFYKLGIQTWNELEKED